MMSRINVQRMNCYMMKIDQCEDEKKARLIRALLSSINSRSNCGIIPAINRGKYALNQIAPQQQSPHVQHLGRE